jgi:hypothetical protein
MTKTTRLIASRLSFCTYQYLTSDQGPTPRGIAQIDYPAGDKPGSERRQQQAHLVRGEPFDPSDVERIHARLAVDEQTLSSILKVVRG